MCWAEAIGLLILYLLTFSRMKVGNLWLSHFPGPDLSSSGGGGGGGILCLDAIKKMKV